jgi:hypothetical protein
MLAALDACCHSMCVALTADGAAWHGQVQLGGIQDRAGRQGAARHGDGRTIGNDKLEEALVETFLDGHEGPAFSEVQWTGIDDIDLLFQDDMEFDDNSSKGMSTWVGSTSNSCSMSVYSPSDTGASDNGLVTSASVCL